MSPLSFELKSKFYDSVGSLPHPEYPRPQLVRNSYINLNGYWEYSILKKGETPKKYDGKILVPFSPEALLSGVMKTVLPTDVIFYKRKFKVPDSFIDEKTILHFGAVDYACAVYLNDIVIGTHRGGYLPFSFDVTKAIKPGNNVIRVEVTDPSDTGVGAKGKQKLKPGNIWYNPQSGIWGTVWLESVSFDYISDLTIVPDIDNDTVTISAVTTAPSIKVTILDNNQTVAEACGKSPLKIKLEKYQLWSPENPKLYDIKISTSRDSITSYFGMRKFSVGEDSSGKRRLMLNNMPYFHTGVLDQGYWSDGKLTPPSDEAMIHDIQMLKDMGFNMIRKHIKIEPLRWYYHCDRLGILVWQDMVNGGSNYNFFAIGILPFIGINVKDSHYKFFSRSSAEGRKEFTEETKQTVNLLKNCVSIAMWVPFNEGWGQFDSDSISEMIKEMDPTRTIDRTSGWHDQGQSDFISLHTYFTPIKVPKDRRCYLLSEFGGFSKATPFHMYRPTRIFGYRVYPTKKKLTAAFTKLYTERIIKNIDKGLSAAVYTQLSDVEEEINGLTTYDRKIEKLDRKTVRALNEQCKIKDR